MADEDRKADLSGKFQLEEKKGKKIICNTTRRKEVEVLNAVNDILPNQHLYATVLHCYKEKYRIAAQLNLKKNRKKYVRNATWL